MGKYVLVVKGSPRIKGNSSLLADQVIEGAKDAGADVESAILQELEIQPCTACDACKKAMDTYCVFQDDMQAIYPKLIRADALVLASPIYWFTMSAQMKLFIDRGLSALYGPPGPYPFKGKKIGIVLSYGDPDPFLSGAVNALRTFQDTFKHVGAEIVGFEYGSAWKAGEIGEQTALLKKAYQLGQKLGIET